MAKPPEPLHEVLPRASLVFDGVVARVVSVAPSAPAAADVPSQQVEVRVARSLRGSPAGDVVTAEKPAGAYALREGSAGPFLLERTDSGLVILGRYGPDSYRIEDVEAALSRGPAGDDEA